MITMFVLAAAMTLAGPADSKDEKAVRSAMDQFAQAVVKKDKPALEKLLADNVMYSHSNAKLENKAEAIAAFLSPTMKYEAIDYKAQTIQIHGKIAVVRGDVNVRNVQDGKPSNLMLNILQVWVHSGQGWQLTARQSTRLP